MVFRPPYGGQEHHGVPLPHPPRYIPRKPHNFYIVDCYNQITYVWLKNGRSFWFYPTSIQYGAVTGFRWNGLFWTFYGFDSRLIDEVSCPPIPTPY
jgi:hypothetical protein